MDWIEFQESLIEEGYKYRAPNIVDEKVIRSSNCPICNKKLLIPLAYTNSNNEYVLYQLCDWCGHYGEV